MMIPEDLCLLLYFLCLQLTSSHCCHARQNHQQSSNSQSDSSRAQAPPVRVLVHHRTQRHRRDRALHRGLFILQMAITSLTSSAWCRVAYGIPSHSPEMTSVAIPMSARSPRAS